jgi:short subunit dehydrogenase-like uncharacterized protein
VAGRIILFGATGYTGRLTAEALVELGARPVLAARSADRLAELSAELGGLETAVADVSDPESVRRLPGRGDVLVTTVGPFRRWGRAAAEAAISSGAHYLDSTGEGEFIREIFESYGPAAEQAGIGMLTAFGYDFVPGNLAGAEALGRAGKAAVRVDVGYYVTGSGLGGMSGGTRSSAAGVVGAPSFAWRDGRVVTERPAQRRRSFPVNGKRRQAISIGGSEHFALPRVAPQLREVNVYLGWFGAASAPMQAMSAVGSVALRIPGTRKLLDAGVARFVKGSTGGPSKEERATGGTYIVGQAFDAAGKQLSEVHLTGIDGYTFTGRILALGAMRAAQGGLQGTGALGPVDAFGLGAMRAGCAQAGLKVSEK